MLLCFFASLTSLFDIVTVYIVTDKEEEIVAVCEVVEEDSSCEAPAKDACTQTPRRWRWAGRGSRMRRLLAFQLMLGVEPNRKAKILVCSETYWMSSGCHILMFNWSFFSAEIFHWRYFVCFCSFARLHFRKFCIIWNRCREEASQYRHHQNFSPTSIHWIQKCECLLHEFEYQIMLSVSVFVSWNSSRKWNHYLNGYTVLLTVSAIKTRHY